MKNPHANSIKNSYTNSMKNSFSNSSVTTSVESCFPSRMEPSETDSDFMFTDHDSVSEDSIIVLKNLDGKQVLGLFSETSFKILSISNEGIDLLDILIENNSFHEMIYNLKDFLISHTDIIELENWLKRKISTSLLLQFKSKKYLWLERHTINQNSIQNLKILNSSANLFLTSSEMHQLIEPNNYNCSASHSFSSTENLSTELHTSNEPNNYNYLTSDSFSSIDKLTSSSEFDDYSFDLIFEDE
jgi:hypothetical protein